VLKYNKCWQYCQHLLGKYFLPLFAMNEKSKKAIVQFGLHLRKLREEQNLGLRQLAARCNVDHAKISDIENAKEDFMFTTLMELARGLGKHPKELLNFDFDINQE